MGMRGSSRKGTGDTAQQLHDDTATTTDYQQLHNMQHDNMQPTTRTRHKQQQRQAATETTWRVEWMVGSRLWVVNKGLYGSYLYGL